MKILFHVINGVGLGHLVRAVNIARQVRELVSHPEILILTNAHDVSMLRAEGLAYVQLPPRLSEPHLDPTRARRALPVHLEHEAQSSVIEAFGPELVVFDTHAPRPVAARAAALGARCVLVLRELRPEALLSWLRSPAARLFHRIVFPHAPDEIDVSSAPPDLPLAVIGPVVRTLPGSCSPELLALTEGPGPLIVAVAGGGGQPLCAARYLRAAADAHLLARARIPSLRTLLLPGPYAKPPSFAGFEGLTVVRGSPDVASLMERASLVIAQAGYNTIAELRVLGKPAILVPGHRSMEDQSARARRLARIGAAVVARPEARAIADRIEALLCEEGALGRMSEAHRRWPLVPANRAVAEALLRPLLAPASVRRIAIVAHDFAPRIGGMETVAHEVASSLLAGGYEVIVYTTRRLGADLAHGLPRGVVRPIFDVGIGGRRIDLEGDLLSLLPALLRDAPDVVHLANAGISPWIPEIQRVWPCRVSVSVHGNDLLVPWVHHPGDEASYQDARSEGLASASVVLPVSSFSAGLALARGAAPGRTRPVSNGVDPHRFHPGERDERLACRLGLAKDHEVLLTVSRLVPRKGHATVLRALSRLAPSRPGLRLVICGAGPSRADLLSLAGRLGVRDRVVLAGVIPEGELPSLYRLARIFVLTPDAPSGGDVEGFGVAFLEAAASGLASIGSRSGGVPEAVLEGETGLLVEPGDDAMLASCLASLLDDPERTCAMGDRGRARVLRELTWAHTCSRMLDAWRASEILSPHLLAPSRLARARERCGEKLASREARRRQMAASLSRGKGVRLRATGDGARFLMDALEDCEAAGIKPDVEIKLRRLLDPDFLEYGSPRVGRIHVVHNVPSPSPDDVQARVEALGPEVLSKIHGLRIFLTEQARSEPMGALVAVPEVHRLRRSLSPRGITVLPPPELMRYLSETPAGGPETAMVEPTNLCNLGCPTCPTGTGKIAPLPEMTVDRFQQALDQLRPRLRNLALWNYGEPMLHRKLPEIIRRAKSAGVAVVKVSSNVHFLDEARGSALLDSGLDVLILSVDGATQETYATFRREGDFATVARSVAWICEEKRRRGQSRPRIDLQFIVMRHNEHEIPEIRRLAREWGVDRLRIKTVNAGDDGSRHLIPASRLFSRYAEDRVTPTAWHPFCTMPWDHAVVNVDGSVTPCCYLRPDMGEKFIMGNVFETPFQEIWRGKRYQELRAAMLEDRGKMPVCGTCRGGTHDLYAAIEEVPRG